MSYKGKCIFHGPQYVWPCPECPTIPPPASVAGPTLEELECATVDAIREQMRKPQPAREWWIEFGEECDPFVMNSHPSFPSDAVHVIEYAAYEKLRAELVHLETEVRDWVARSSRQAQTISEREAQVAEARAENKRLLSEWGEERAELNLALNERDRLREALTEVRAEVERYRHIVDEEAAYSNRLREAVERIYQMELGDDTELGRIVRKALEGNHE